MIVWGDIDADLKAALEQSGLGSVEGAFSLSAGEDLNKPNLGTRRRTRLTVRDAKGREREVYLKRYGPGRWWQRLGKFVSIARKERDAICRVRDAGVPTMEPLAMGELCPLCDGRSYLVVSSVPGESLEKGGRALFTCADAGAATDKLAELVGNLHRAGLVHRDLYACHVFASGKDAGGPQVRRGEAPLAHMGETPMPLLELHLIDLARVFRPRWRKFRWFVKDLAQLHYSMPAEWAEKHWMNFLIAYLRPRRADELDRWRRAIERKSAWIRARAARKAARAKGGCA